MAKVRALVIGGNGTNCERETAHACTEAGAETSVVPIWDVVAGDVKLADYQFLCLPGGFMDGDDLGAARAGANRYRYARIAGEQRRLWDDVQRFVFDEKLIIGICNGFQLMVKLGLLPQLNPKGPSQTVTLTFNDSGRFEDRWVDLVVDPDSPCVFTRGLRRLQLPVRHGEGKLVTATERDFWDLEQRWLVPVRYADPDTAMPTEQYPANPNGSAGGAAGLCDPTGRLFGLMPHPEAYIHRTHHPQWTRLENLPERGNGLAMFENAVSYLS